MRLISLVFVILTVAFGGCDSGGSSSSQGLTIDYVENELHLEGYSTSGTAVIYEGSPSGSTYEFNRVIISKVNNTTNDTLAYAYSLTHPQLVDKTRFVAFYIDTDYDPDSGESIEGIGADRLLLDTTIFESSPASYEYFIWSGSQWDGQSVDGSGITISWDQGSTTLSINVPVYLNISDLFGLIDAKGVFTVRTLNNGDPNDINATTLATTTVFTFNTPP